MTPENLSALATRAYRDLGYQVVTFRDGSKGVLKCPTKTINLVNRLQELVLDALEAEAASKHTCATCTTCPGCLAALADDGATFERLSKSFDGKEREWSPAEKFQLYSRGFRDGAATRAMRHEGLGAYEVGYAEGRQSVRLAVDSYAKRVGYEPTILRTTATTPGAGEDRGGA